MKTNRVWKGKSAFAELFIFVLVLFFYYIFGIIINDALSNIALEFGDIIPHLFGYAQ